MRARAAALLLASACIASLASIAAQAPHAPSPGERIGLIDGLDALLQRRFEDVDQRFGMTRLTEPGDFHQTLRLFRPENAQEIAAVRALDRAGLQVVLYLAGRALLSGADAPAAPAWPMLRRAMAGPLLLNRPSGLDVRELDLPEPRALVGHGRQAFRQFDRAATHAFALGAWHFDARPVRASRGECLECHRGATAAAGRPARPAPRVGDALGVVLYATRSVAGAGTR